MFEIKVRGEFDSAHFLENTGTKCDDLHGHRWVVWVTLQSDKLSPTGWVINFTVVKKWLKEILEEFDHSVLNYYLDQPTAENLCFVIFRHIHIKILEYNAVPLETRTCPTCNGVFECRVDSGRRYNSRKCANVDTGKRRKEKKSKQESVDSCNCGTKMNVQVQKVEIAETPDNLASYSCFDISVKKESARRGIRKFWRSGEHKELRKLKREASKRKWADPKKREEIIEKMIEAGKDPEQRRKKSERMILNNPMKNRRNVEKMIASLRKSQKLSPNKEEQKIIEFMKRNTLAFLFVGNGSYIVDGKIPDFINKSKKIVVEYNNRFWHCNDNPWYDVKDDSEERRKFFEERGYKFYIIWSDEFEKNKEQIKTDLERLLKG